MIRNHLSKPTLTQIQHIADTLKNIYTWLIFFAIFKFVLDIFKTKQYEYEIYLKQ